MNGGRGCKPRLPVFDPLSLSHETTRTMDERVHRNGYVGIALAAVAQLLAIGAARTDEPGGRRPAIETPHAAVLPAVPAGSRLIVTHLYTLSLNPQTKLADWCAYRVTPGLFETDNRLLRNWSTVHAAEALESDDYTGSGYDRGHLVPLASFAASPWCSEVNRTEAVIPQRPALNAGPWLRLEEHVRELARTHGRVDCLAGPVYLAPLAPLPQADEPHRVPSHCWLVLQAAGETEAYLLPQDAARGESPAAYRLTLPELRRIVPELPR